MESISSCFGGRKKRDSDHEPLLPRYADDTVLQRELHEKLHTYQQLRAISKGFMPSTEQVIINLRTLLAADVLNPDNPDLSESGRALVRSSKQWLQNFVELLRNKNGEDQIQDLVWFLSKSRISMDTDDIAVRAKKTKAKADTIAAYQSLKTVGSLMLMNEDFRVFLGDINVMGREVFRDSAFKLSTVAEEAGKKVEPSQEDHQLITLPGEDDKKGSPSGQQLEQNVEDVSKAVANGTAEVSKTAAESAGDKLSGDEGQTILKRLQEAILNLRQRTDYNASVSTLSLLIQRYAFVYSRAASDISDVASEDTHQNAALDQAARNGYALLTSFGDKKEWEKCEELFKKVMSHSEKDPEFESMMTDVGNSLQRMLTDPSFFENAHGKFDELRTKSQNIGKESSLRQDIDDLLRQLATTFQSIVHDQDIHKILNTTLRLFNILSPLNHATNPELIQDTINVFVPLLISAIQYLPIPRLELSTPGLDLLLENLIIEPGHTVNQSSFFPHTFKLETYNDLSLHRTHTLRTAASHKHLLTLKLNGLTARADEVGFWLNTHSGLLRFHDAGIASLALDDRGIDIHLDVEVAQERVEQMLTLKAVRVHIHKLNYTVRQSRLGWLSFLLKPLLRPLIRRSLEKSLAASIADLFHAANRELLFARERLRATRIADPDDLLTFVKAVAARLTPAEDPETYTGVGVAQPGEGVFKGVYAPGSVVKVWNEEGARAGERVEDFDAGGWRNGVFDNHVRGMT